MTIVVLCQTVKNTTEDLRKKTHCGQLAEMMHQWLLCLLLIVISTQACTTDVDCHYNGVCTNSVCLCDYGWKGPACTNMSFAIAPYVGAYGYSPNITAWGGLPILVNGTYHHYVVELVNDCGLCHWGSNSRIVHATSKNLLGPYTFHDVALPVFAHNPHVVVDHSSGSPVYLLFHIGDGDGGVTPAVCNETLTTPKHPFLTSGVLHTATDPAGPWTPQTPTGLGLCNNPAPYVFPNGTIFLRCVQDHPNLFYADSWKGPWTATSTTYSGDPGEGNWEDFFVWVDKRGVWKLIAHVYPIKNTTAHFWDRVSGFSYSLDGFHWVPQSFQPYTNEVQYANGTVGYTTRERPKIFFDPSDNTTPLALFNGVAEGTNCWDCKQTCGVDWTFNLVVGISP